MRKISVLLFVLFFYSCQKAIDVDHDMFVGYDELQASDLVKENYLDSLKQNILHQSNDSLSRKNLFKVASRYEKLGANQKYFKLIKSLHSLSKEKNDTLDIARSLWYIGDYYAANDKLDSTFYYYSQSEKYYRLSKKDQLNWARLLSYKAEVLFKTGIYTESESELLKALKIFKKENHTRFLYEVNLQMALVLQQIKDFENALKYYLKAEEYLNLMVKENPSSERVGLSKVAFYNNLGNLYNSKRDFDLADIEYKKALSFKEINNDSVVYAMVLNNYGYNKLLSGDIVGVDSLLFKALSIRQKIDNTQGVVASKQRIGEFYLTKNKLDSALIYFKDAYQLARKSGNLNDVVKSLELLSINSKEESDYFTHKYIEAKDSLRNLENFTKNRFARISYETAEISKENETLSKRYFYSLILFLFASISAVSIFIWDQFKLKNRELKYKAKEQESTEKIYELLLKEKLVEEEAKAEERDRIAAELHDGIVNRIFTTRFNLERLNSEDTVLKDKLLTELRNTEQHVREVSHQLNGSYVLDGQDFVRLLEELCSMQKNSFNTQFEIDIDKSIDWSKVSSKVKVNLYRIIQESYQNINKYSKATKSFVLIFKTSDDIVLRIHDNGEGFNPDKVKNGLGLKSIDKRAKEIGAKFNLKSGKGKGTTIELCFTLN